ncbi:phosphoethanolamine--lipid A transferase EptA [Marinomonas sp. CT5]|uniref:phosphoethanolamine--lipid A transferase EptA n=1 Tax=Marinomonas sp. CT5 TaxID=2066133 RepID=UPI0018247D20|nr:phosphoethanolamine--lipid A transferase EptA [Marinomonas sp. CT5]NVK73505.1 phosphoethanolamine--lipid A transferase EptA [Oceanospirillaceae bacterium]QUX97953.1 phosphoethanolamine--lipid A transferase EptA [Marinomonas sp. CT5]
MNSNRSVSSNSGSFFKRGLTFKPSTSTFVIVLALLNAVLYNWPLLLFSLKNLDGLTLNGLHTLLVVFTVIYLVTTFVLYLLFMVSRRLGKTICVILALANSLAVYFVVSYNVILGTSMIGNILNTQYSESEQFLSPKLVIYFIVLGVIPAWLIIRTSVQKTSRLRLFIYLIITIIVSSTFLWQSQSKWLWIDDHAKQLGGRIMPWSYVGNTIRYKVQQSKENVVQTLLPDATFHSNEKTVVVLVIGESARAENFSLYGYNKPTNPLLTASNVITMKNATSCATYTTAAVKCILSHNDPSGVFSENFEPLPSYLERQGIDVFWRTKNWGEPPIKVASYLDGGDLKANCKGDECDYDGVLLSHLADQIEASDKQKIFVVLHQTGSHGPSYYTKYPKEFEVFKPVCRSVELSNCTQEELINAYDNTILYNDHFLDQLRLTLKSLKNTSSAYLYISDHGESLGENGIYLHGTPYSIAPEQQLKVPFFVWMSPSFIAQRHVSVDKLKARKVNTQANIFHSVMGAFDMDSKIYNKDLDIFRAARQP